MHLDSERQGHCHICSDPLPRPARNCNSAGPGARRSGRVLRIGVRHHGRVVGAAHPPAGPDSMVLHSVA